MQIHLAPDWPTFQKMLEQGQLPIFRLSWYADIPHSDNFLSPLVHSTSRTNHTFYSDPSVDQLLEQARRERDENRRIALYRELERLVMGDAPWITQYHYVGEYLYQPYVQEVEINSLRPHTIPVKNVWLKKRPTEGFMRATPHAESSR